MFDHTKEQLDNIMASFQDDYEGIKTQKDIEKQAQEKFSTDFEQVKKDVIWPAIVDIGNQLNSYGHDYHVTEEAEYVDATANYMPSSITLNIRPSILKAEESSDDSTPYISFSANKYAQKVAVIVSTMLPERGGVIGTDGEYELSDFTTEFIEQKIIDVIKKSFLFHL